MIVTKTFDEARGAADVPDHPEGKRWPYVVIALNGDTIYADSATEVIEATIADYSSFKVIDENGDSEFFDAGNDLALIARYDDLLRYATAWQETVFAAAIEDGSFDPSQRDRRRAHRTCRRTGHPLHRLAAQRRRGRHSSGPRVGMQRSTGPHGQRLHAVH